MLTKSTLSIILSKLEGFTSQKVRLEQYPTDATLAAEWLWNAHMLGDLTGTIIDQGSGTGILGIGAHLLGATKVFFIESEGPEVRISKKNLQQAQEQAENTKKSTFKASTAGKVTFYHQNVHEHTHKGDVVLQNPPFGTREKGADIAFLEAAFRAAPVIYSMHKSTTRAHIQKVSEKAKYTITHTWQYTMPLKARYAHHTRKIKKIDVDVHRIEREKQK